MDLLGPKAFASLNRIFFKDADIIILVYSINHKSSFEDIKNYLYEDVKKYEENYSVLALVGNKIDLKEYEQVDENIAKEFAEKINAIFMLVSAKNGNNIKNLFDTVIDVYFKRNPQLIIEQNEESEAEIKKHRKDNKNMKNKKILIH